MGRTVSGCQVQAPQLELLNDQKGSGSLNIIEMSSVFRDPQWKQVCHCSCSQAFCIFASKPLEPAKQDVRQVTCQSVQWQFMRTGLRFLQYKKLSQVVCLPAGFLMLRFVEIDSEHLNKWFHSERLHSECLQVSLRSQS